MRGRHKIGNRYTHLTIEECVKYGKLAEQYGCKIEYGVSKLGSPYYKIIDIDRRKRSEQSKQK